MTYAQFHDGFYKNRKVRRVGPEAAWLWAASIGYANENLTDGFIPVENLGELIEMDSKPRAKLIAKLVEAQLWEVVEGGWQVHDFLKWNFSREQVLAKRQANLDRVNKHRGKTAKTGDGNPRVMHYNDRDNAGDGQGDERSDKQGEKQPSSGPPVLIPNSPPPTPPASRERAQAPAKAPPSEPEEGPPADSEPEPEVVAEDQTEPAEATKRPSQFPRPHIVPKPPSGEAMFERMGMAEGCRLDRVGGTPTDRLNVFRRLEAYNVDERLADRMSLLLCEPAKVWPWARKFETDPTGKVRITWLLGAVNANGERGGDALGQLVDRAQDSLDADDRRAAAEAKRAELAALARQHTPGPVSAGKTDAAIIASLRSTLKDRPSAPTSDAIVTLATGAQ